MKILFVQKMAGISGSEKYYLSLLPLLKKQGIDVHFLVVQHKKNAAKNQEFIELLAKDNIAIHIITSSLPISLGILWKMYRLIRRESFDLVQTNLIHADAWGACVKKFFMPSLKIISVKHGYDEKYQQRFGFEPDHLKKNLFYHLTKWSAKYASKVVSISKSLQDLLVKGGMVSAGKADVIPYGFDFDDIIPKVAPGKVRYGDPQIIIAGRLVPVKQHHLVLEIMPLLIKKFPDIQLVIVGAGPSEEALKKMASDLTIEDHIKWEGFRNNMHDYIRDSDLMVLPSSAEGFGLVILEAWHHKKPVIAFDVPAPNEIIEDGKNGCLITPFDVKRLYKTISKVLDDRETLNRIGQAGYKTLKDKYSLATMCENTIKIYQQALHEKE